MREQQLGRLPAPTVKVGVVGDSNEAWDQVVIPNLKKEGINVELVKFSDYIQPNEALAKGDIDLNAYQGYILMDDFNKTHDNALAAVGETVAQPDQPVLRQGQEGRRHSGRLRSHHRQRLRQRGPAACCCSSPPA